MTLNGDYQFRLVFDNKVATWMVRVATWAISNIQTPDLIESYNPDDQGSSLALVVHPLGGGRFGR